MRFRARVPLNFATTVGFGLIIASVHATIATCSHATVVAIAVSTRATVVLIVVIRAIASI